MKNGRDGGFNYWKLNYKKKFIRSLWMIPVIIFLTIQMVVTGASVKITIIWATVLFVTLIVQLLYTYFKWKNETPTEGLKKGSYTG